MNSRNLTWMVASLALACAALVRGVEVPQWKTADLSFKSTTTRTNPFFVDFAAEVSGPDGLHFTQPGFYDGDQTWKIRLGPNLPGKWSVHTVSSDPQLDGKAGEVTCLKAGNPQVHGGLLVDPEHPHHFVREDGSRFFYSGFECDWLWALDLETCDPSLPETSILLDKLATYRFNVVYVNVYAHTGFGRRDQKPNFGPPPKYPWAGSNANANYSVLNLPFWQHYDRVIQAMWERGLEAHIMIKVYNKNVKWPAIGSPEDDLYFKTVVARYAPFCNVHWDFSKESNNEKNMAYKLDRMAFIRKNDPYRRLLTTHTDRKDYTNFYGVLDYRTDQNHTNYYKTAFRQRSREAWPVVNSEYGYEQGPLGAADKTYSGADDALTIFKRAWEAYMAGAYGAYYYTYTSWDVIRVNDTPAGYGYYRNLADFFDGVGLWKMDPNDSLVGSGHCLANPGVEYVVYQPERKEFTLKVANASGDLAATWFNPVTGESIKAPSVQNGLCKLSPPADWTNGPVVLHAGKAPMEKAEFRNTFSRALPKKSAP